MHVLLVLCDLEEGRVSASLHLVHDDILALADFMPCAKAVRALALRRVGTLLGALERLRAGPQREVERARAAGRGLLAVASPVLYHDACTLYAALVLTAAGVPPWLTFPKACQRCGDNAWGVTCTPPAIRRGRLVRQALDDCVAFCWTCLGTRTSAV